MANLIVKTWVVVQKLASMSVEVLLEYSIKVVKKMKGPVDPPPPVPNPNFVSANPVPANPSLDEVSGLITGLNDAFTSIIGGKPKTLAIKTAKGLLIGGMNNLGNYVEIVSNMPSNVAIGDQIIVSAGMDYRKSGAGFKVQDLMVKYNPKQAGDVLARDKRLDKGTVYAWMVKPKADTNWKTVKKGTGCKYTYKNIAAAVIYEFQVEHSLPDGTVTLSSVQELPTPLPQAPQ